jgi:hypothetical protein
MIASHKLPVSHSLPNSLAVPVPIRTLLSTSFVSSGIIIFGNGYENCPEFEINSTPLATGQSDYGMCNVTVLLT